MRKILFFFVCSIVLCGCESKDTKLRKDYATFREWHYSNCFCVLGNKSNFVNKFLDSINKMKIFCRISADFYLDTKSKKEIQQDVEFMRNIGKYQCSPTFLEKIQKKSAEYNFNSNCWTDEVDMEYKAKLTNLVISCENTYKHMINVDCECVVKTYANSLSYTERAELQAYGSFFPSYGWMVNTPHKQAITLSVMNKMREAVLKCKSN